MTPCWPLFVLPHIANTTSLGDRFRHDSLPRLRRFLAFTLLTSSNISSIRWASALAPSCVPGAALKWPLQEAFRVGFDHPDFRRQATGLFHSRPPPSSPIPQRDLNADLRFYETVDVTACTLRLAFLKAFLTALASGNRCAELAHFSRRALVDSGSHFTLGVMPRFLYKNQASGRSPPPVSIPLFRAHPALCPVVTLRGYLARTALCCLIKISCLYIRLPLLPWLQVG